MTNKTNCVLYGLQTKLEERVIHLNMTIEHDLFEVFSKVMNILCDI